MSAAPQLRALLRSSDPLLNLQALELLAALADPGIFDEVVPALDVREQNGTLWAGGGLWLEALRRAPPDSMLARWAQRCHTIRLRIRGARINLHPLHGFSQLRALHLLGDGTAYRPRVVASGTAVEGVAALYPKLSVFSAHTFQPPLEGIGQIPEVTLQAVPLTDLAALTGDGIRTLRLQRCPGLRSLVGLPPTIQELDLSSELGRVRLGDLHRLSLSSLHIEAGPTDVRRVLSVVGSGLRHLSVRFQQGDRDDVSSILSVAPGLVFLRLAAAASVRVTLAHPHLTHLELRGVQVPASVVALPGLKQLSVRDGDVEDLVLPVGLRSLRLKDCTVQSQRMRVPAGAALQSLEIDHSDLYGTGPYPAQIDIGEAPALVRLKVREGRPWRMVVSGGLPRLERASLFGGRLDLSAMPSIPAPLERYR